MQDSERKKQLSPCPSLTSLIILLPLQNFWEGRKRILHYVLDYSAADGNKPFPEVDSQPLHVVQSFGLHGQGQGVSRWAVAPQEWEYK